MPTNDTFQEGYDAYWDGIDVSGNPLEEDMTPCGNCLIRKLTNAVFEDYHVVMVSALGE